MALCQGHCKQTDCERDHVGIQELWLPRDRRQEPGEWETCDSAPVSFAAGPSNNVFRFRNEQSNCKIHLFFQTNKLLVLKNEIEVAQFQSNSPQYLPIAEEFWKALVKLPSVYYYAAYRSVLERFGTHYLAEGTLGGSFKAVARIDQETEKQISKDNH